MSFQDLKKQLDPKMKALKVSKFGWEGSNAPNFSEVSDGIGIDAQGVAYEKDELAKKIELAKKQKLDISNKDDAVKDDQIEGADVHTGEDSTGFGYVGAFDQFMSACRQSGGSAEHCVEAWLLKNAGMGLTEEKVKLITEYLKGKKVDTLEYNDGDLERIKNDFGLDLKPILERVDGICANNKKLVAENKKIKEDFVGMKGIVDAITLSWLKKAKARKLELKEILTENYEVKEDFVKDKDLPELENYLKLLLDKEKGKDDGVKLTPEEQYKRDMNDKNDGVDTRFHGNSSGIINDFEGYIDGKMEVLKKDKFGYGVED